MRKRQRVGRMSFNNNSMANFEIILNRIKVLEEIELELSVLSKGYSGLNYESNLSKIIEKIMRDYFSGNSFIES